MKFINFCGMPRNDLTQSGGGDFKHIDWADVILPDEPAEELRNENVVGDYVCLLYLQLPIAFNFINFFFLFLLASWSSIRKRISRDSYKSITCKNRKICCNQGNSMYRRI